jgi:hypothetical protein
LWYADGVDFSTYAAYTASLHSTIQESSP